MKMLSALVFTDICLASPVVFTDEPGNPAFPRCLVQSWVNRKCTGTCGGLYTVCPGKVMCLYAAVGAKHASAFVLTPVPCEDYSGGTGTCNATSVCTGGTYVGASSTTVMVQVSECPATDCP